MTVQSFNIVKSCLKEKIRQIILVENKSSSNGHASFIIKLIKDIVSMSESRLAERKSNCQFSIKE